MDNTNTSDANNGSTPTDPSQTPVGDQPMTPPVVNETPVADETPVTPGETPAMPTTEPEQGNGGMGGGTPTGTV